MYSYNFHNLQVLYRDEIILWLSNSIWVITFIIFASHLRTLHSYWVTKIHYWRETTDHNLSSSQSVNPLLPNRRILRCNQVSPLVLTASCSCFASTASFRPPYSWLTTALRVSTALSFTASAYRERSLSGSDSFCIVRKLSFVRRTKYSRKLYELNDCDVRSML